MRVPAGSSESPPTDRTCNASQPQTSTKPAMYMIARIATRTRVI
jgi:hypothetical protein